jgi:uncharacterized protein (DUF849 family)
LSTRPDRRYEPIVVTAAICGGDVLPSQSAALPRGVDQIVREAVEAAAAGAAAVHLHARDETGRPTSDPDVYAAIGEGIRAECDVVLNVTTGGSLGWSVDQRLAGVKSMRPEIATFNLGTMNYHLFPDPARWPQVETDWERAVIESSDDTIFPNTLRTLREVARTLRELGVTPELEAYDHGHLQMARLLIDEGTLEPPVRVQLVLGVPGAAGNALDDLVSLRATALRILGSDLGSLAVAATGFPMEFRHAAAAMGLEMHCRVGMEDNLRVRRDRPVERNAELVEVVAKLADLLARPLATPDELRSQLGPWYARAPVLTH